MKGTSEGDRIVGEPVAADFVGRFTVAALAGRDHIVFAERKRRHARGLVRSDPRLLRRREADPPHPPKALLNRQRGVRMTLHVTPAEDWNLERQRHPRAPRSSAGLGARRSVPTFSACRRSRRLPTRFRCSCASSRATGATGTARRGTRASACTCARSSHPNGRRSRIPQFDYENRIVTVRTAARHSRVGLRAERRQGLSGEDAVPRRRSTQFAADAQADPLPLVICGDLNVARTDMDVHPKERKPRAIGQLPEERALLEQHHQPRARRRRPRARTGQRSDSSRGGRPGATCASATSAGASTTSSPASRSSRASSGSRVQREFGTSDHAPVVAEFEQ